MLFQDAILRCLELLLLPSAKPAEIFENADPVLANCLDFPPVRRACSVPLSPAGSALAYMGGRSPVPCSVFHRGPSNLPFTAREQSLPPRLFHPRASPRPFWGRSWAVSSPVCWMDPVGERCPGRPAALARRDRPAACTGSLLGKAIAPAKTPCRGSSGGREA